MLPTAAPGEAAPALQEQQRGDEHERRRSLQDRQDVGAIETRELPVPYRRPHHGLPLRTRIRYDLCASL